MNIETSYKSYCGIKLFNTTRNVLSVFDMDITNKTPKKTEIHKGFDKEISSVNPDEPHSIENLDQYISSGVPHSIADDIIKNNRTVEVHNCTDIEALKSLQDRGFTNTALVKKQYICPGGSAGGSLLLKTQSPKTGEIRYIMSNIIGKDMNIHNQLQLKLSGIDDKNVIIFDHKSDIASLFDHALDKVGKMPEKVIIGYRGHFKSEITRRALYSRKLDYLKDKFGNDAYNGLLEKLRSLEKNSNENSLSVRNVIKALEDNQDKYGKTLSLSRKEVFKQGENTDIMMEFETFLKTLADENPKSGSLSDLFIGKNLKIGEEMDPDKFWAGEKTDDILFPTQLFTFIKENKTKEEVLITRFRYGDLSGIAAKEIINRGAKEIFHLGNAGVLSQNGKIGELHFPSQIFDEKGELVDQKTGNFLADYLRQKGTEECEGNIKLSTKHRKVSSPLIETKPFIQNLQNEHFDGIDVETSEIAKVVRQENINGNTVKLSTAILTSDMPGMGGGRTIENMRRNEYSTADYRNSFSFIVDTLFDYWGIEDVEISDSPKHYKEPGKKLSSEMPSFPQILGDIKGILLNKYVIRRKAETEHKEIKDLADIVADKILEEKNLNDENHMLLKENIATFIINGMTPGNIKVLSQEPKINTSFISCYFENSRWMKKIDRDLKNPYKDSDVLKHIKEVDQSLKDTIDTINKESTGFPKNIYVIGSFAKGRFGTSSDLDLLFDIKDKNMRKYLHDDYLKKRMENINDSCMTNVLPENKLAKKAETEMWGKRIDLGNGSEFLKDKDFLLKEYDKILEDKGFHITEDMCIKRIKNIDKRKETNWLQENIVQKFVEKNANCYESEGKESMFVKNAKELVATCAGFILLMPVIGFFGEKILSRFT